MSYATETFENQQQTYVTKHDLNLLHKKIIATDLIVQKYQDANKALLRSQAENDDLKQQVEQITNECCIFGKQVTECTQECDHLKEQIDLVNSEKRELHQQLRLLQDENTNIYHEIMVLKQYESLKETNDRLSKTIERQQKQLGKLQLQVQRKSPIVYKPTKDKNEPSETDIALKNSQKAVRELKLALARLMNFIQVSKIEVPTSLLIRPVLKAHDINDDFLEIEGEYVLKPVKKKSKPVISQTNNDGDDEDDDDDDHGDFIDVTNTPAVQPEPVNIPNPPVDVIETTSKSSSRQQKKKKELPKVKETKKSSIKSRRKKDLSISEDPSVKLDDLANELDIALSQTNQQPESQNSTQLTSFLSDDDDEDKIHKSDTKSFPIYTPISFQSSILPSQKLSSTITIVTKPTNALSSDLSFFSEDDNDEPLQDKCSQSSTIPMLTKSTLDVDSITPMDVEISNKPTNYMSFLSEDDDDNRSLTSVSTPNNQEFICSLDFKPLKTNDNETQSSNIQTSIAHSTIDVVQETLSSYQQHVETISENDHVEKESAVIVNTLDSNRIEIVSRLLNILIHPPISLKPLKLIRRRIQEKKISEPQSIVIENNQSTDKHEDTTAEQIDQQQQPKLVDETSKVINEEEEEEEEEAKHIPVSMEEHDEILTENNETPVDKLNSSIDEKHSTPIEEENDSTSSQIATKEIVQPTEEQMEIVQPTEEQMEIVQPTEEQMEIVQPTEEQMEIVQPTEEQMEICQEPTIVVNEIPIDQTSILIDKTQETIEEQILIIDEIQHHSILNDTPENPMLDEIPKNSILENVQAPTTINIIQQDTVEYNQPLVTKKKTSKKPLSQEYELIPKPVEKTTSISTLKTVPVKPVLEKCNSSLTSFQLTVVSRLLNILTKLPVKPLSLPMPYPSKKTKRQVAIKKSPVKQSDLTSRSTNRMQTRSINSIRSCIARCNKPMTINRKRPITESIGSLPAIPKRMKSARIEHNNNTIEYNLIHKFINSLSKEMNDDLRNLLQEKLHEDLLLFNDNIYRIFSDLMFSKCDIILRLVNQLHSYEESIKILLTYIYNQSSVIQQHFITKLQQAFEFEIKQQPIIINRIKILNRLFFITCSIFSTSSTIIHARLFDIGYYLSQDILIDALKFTCNICSMLISIDSQSTSSNIFLHQILMNILQSNQVNVSLEYLKKLINNYDRNKHDQEDLIRSFIIVSRHQSWSWCSMELCSKILLPLLNDTDDQNQQRINILTILQYILFIYKDDSDFKRDIKFHDQTKQLLLSLNLMNSFETTVRDKILFILHTCY